ncbi:MAG: hypothetical protein P8P30_01910 [Rickettsiales bacterium]|nr:hypothetical protein [Rickettsiales bacterium]
MRKPLCHQCGGHLRKMLKSIYREGYRYSKGSILSSYAATAYYSFMLLMGGKVSERLVLVAGSTPN